MWVGLDRVENLVERAHTGLLTQHEVVHDAIAIARSGNPHRSSSFLRTIDAKENK
jgi:hypothetical protein